MKISQHFSLRKLNTFGIESIASNFATAIRVDELQEIFQGNFRPIRILGGGSNILLTGNPDGLVVKNEIGGIDIIEENADYSIVAAGGGVEWHELVLWSLEKNLGGLENLSLIPGSVGAAPIQNIGAYGVELKDVFDRLEAVEIETGQLKIFSVHDCNFGYRDSIFKQDLKGKFCITRVYLKLSKNPVINKSYGDIQKTLDEKGIVSPTIKDISEAVIKIRRSKLPDPSEIGNAGSFFKNPEMGRNEYEALKKLYPPLPGYPVPDDKIKVPAGWLIEKAGWKGKRFGDAGCHVNQALVLVNYGNAAGVEILDLACKIQASVMEQFGIHLIPEVNIWGK